MAQLPGSLSPPADTPPVPGTGEAAAEPAAADVHAALGATVVPAPESASAPNPIAQMATRAGFIRQHAAELASADPERNAIIEREQQLRVFRPDAAERTNGIVKPRHVASAIRELIVQEYIPRLSESEKQQVLADIESPATLVRHIRSIMRSWQGVAYHTTKTQPKLSQDQQLLAGHVDSIMHAIRRDMADIHGEEAEYYLDGRLERGIQFATGGKAGRQQLEQQKARDQRVSQLMHRVVLGWDWHPGGKVPPGISAGILGRSKTHI